jgi:hypothetical protein
MSGYLFFPHRGNLKKLPTLNKQAFVQTILPRAEVPFFGAIIAAMTEIPHALM